jgi:hypothetical protein
MADASIAILAPDILNLSGSSFNPQNALVQKANKVWKVKGEEGLVEGIDSVVGADVLYTMSYRYCGTALRTDLGALLTAFGDVVNGGAYSYLTVNGLTIVYEAAKYPLIVFRGHQHQQNNHTVSFSKTTDISGLVPQSAFGVPDFGITMGSNASPVTAVFNAAHGHADVYAEDGTHEYGDNTKELTYGLEMGIAGTPTSSTEVLLEADLAVTNFSVKVNSLAELKDNTKFTSFAFIAEGYRNT